MSYSKHRPLLFLGILLLTTVAVGCAVAVIPGVTRGVGATFSGHLWRAVPGGSGDITSDEELIVVLGSDPEYRDPETGARIYPTPDWGGLLGELPEWVRVSPDGELVAAAAGREGPGNHVRVWLVGDRNHLYEIAPLSEEPPQAAYAPLAFSPDNKHIAFHLSGLQRGDLIEEGRYELVNRYMVQIMTWPELKPLTAWGVPPAFRWLGWPDNSAVWVVSVVSGYTRGSHLGSMVRWELDLDLLHAGDTLPPSPAREITFD